MRDYFFKLDPGSDTGLQAQLRRQILTAIHHGNLAPGDPLPSSRRLARRLRISRNTITLAYQSLIEEGYLESRPRSGVFVAADLKPAPAARNPTGGPPDSVIDWNGRLVHRPSDQRNITKPQDWRAYRYPFIYGQADPTLFPLAAWRECSRRALGKLSVNEWTADHVHADDPQLVDLVRRRILPRRGIHVSDAEILISMGAQNALWMVANLLVGPQSTVGLENPGYVDARNIFSLAAAEILPLAVDRDGLCISRDLGRCDVVYTTVNHQSPTTVTMPFDRRQQLLDAADAHDFVIIEDDYEAEANYLGDPLPALKADDRNGRIVYVGSFSKSVAPGLRLGYLVAPAEVISEIRHLRRLMLRHPPANNQLTMALFIEDGHFDGLVRRLHRVYRQRWTTLGNALDEFLPGWSTRPACGGTSYWIDGPENVDAQELAATARGESIIIEPGDIHFFGPGPAPRNFFRLGFSSIVEERIRPGIERLAGLIDRQQRR